MKTPLELLTASTLKPILEKVSHLEDMNVIWKEIVDPEISCHSYIANYDKGILTVAAINASWGTRLRYEAPEIQKQLLTHRAFQQLQRIKVKILYELKASD